MNYNTGILNFEIGKTNTVGYRYPQFRIMIPWFIYPEDQGQASICLDIETLLHLLLKSRDPNI